MFLIVNIMRFVGGKDTYEPFPTSMHDLQYFEMNIPIKTTMTFVDLSMTNKSHAFL